MRERGETTRSQTETSSRNHSNLRLYRNYSSDHDFTCVLFFNLLTSPGWGEQDCCPVFTAPPQGGSHASGRPHSQLAVKGEWKEYPLVPNSVTFPLVPDDNETCLTLLVVTTAFLCHRGESLAG